VEKNKAYINIYLKGAQKLREKLGRGKKYKTEGK
jgi:hypothetical protein